MANWRNLAMTLILADGQIDDTEVKILKKELFADKKIDKEEAEFLVELRNKALEEGQGDRHQPCLREVVLHRSGDAHSRRWGVIDADETALSGRVGIFADKKVDDNERNSSPSSKKLRRRPVPDLSRSSKSARPRGVGSEE